MDDKLKIWTAVGSAESLNQADLAKVTLHGSVIQVGVDTRSRAKFCLPFAAPS
jgi:hypothetical protein